MIEAATDVRDQLLELAEEALEASRDDLELAESTVRVKGSPTKSVTIADLAATAQGGKLLIGKGSGTPAAPPEVDGSGCVGRLGMESLVAPTFITHITHCKIDRETGVVRVLDVAASHDVGPDPQPDRSRGPGRRRGGDGHRHGAARRARRSAPKAARSTPTCSTTSCRRCPMRRRSSSGSWISSTPTGPYGGKGIGEPPCVPTPGAIANAIAQVTGAR